MVCVRRSEEVGKARAKAHASCRWWMEDVVSGQEGFVEGGSGCCCSEHYKWRTDLWKI